MKYFVYTCAEGFRYGHTDRTVRIYSIIKNQLIWAATRTESCIDEFQLVMKTLEIYELLPKRAFERGPSGGFKYKQAGQLQAAGIANVQRI